jgi:DNA-binding NarL/FixJ family response regulator
MRTLLIIAPNTGLAAAVRAALDASRYRVIEHDDCREDELRLTGASIDVCCVDADLTTVEPIRNIQRLRRLLPQCPVILYASDSHRSWEEEAYLLGVSHVLSKPVRGRLLNSLLDRLFAGKTNGGGKAGPGAPARLEDKRAAEAPPVPGRMLELLRNSSSILCHSLCAESLLKEFLLVLREILGLNRAAIFLRAAPRGAEVAEAVAGDSQRLTSACALGLAPGVLEHFELSLDAGIGGYLFRSGRVLRRDSAEVERDPRMAREFDLLGVRVAIPVLDRESLVGVAMLDERITGEPMSNDELALIFHLLEQLGLAIKNIWWHEQVSARHEMMFDILRNIKAGCVVIGPELNVLHANETARAFSPAQPPAEAFDFNDLPQVIGGKVFTVLKTGQPVVDYKYQSASAASASVSRFPSRPSARRIPPRRRPRWWWWKIAPPPTAFANWKSKPPICAWSSKWPSGWRTKSATPSCPSPPTSSSCANGARTRTSRPPWRRPWRKASNASAGWWIKCASWPATA